jgi:hypothetical protein
MAHQEQCMHNARDGVANDAIAFGNILNLVDEQME